ncbi:MAG: OsmC family protein [Bacteroidales bacterium]|nr:OsmC family protein [Bacteroidales bacterium]HOY38918.1 OsmC family protein [Bacteroidales bacterium]HQN92572.1 OsmC family protein [Prolixibacteraceae bacterium]
MDMEITFDGGKVVTAHFNGHDIKTDQPSFAGGLNSAPTPFELFLASLGTCAGIYVKFFCDSRNLPTDGIRIIQHMEFDNQSGLPLNFEFEIQVPPDFPEKYHSALVSSAEFCKVKKTIENPPTFKAYTTVK